MSNQLDKLLHELYFDYGLIFRAIYKHQRVRKVKCCKIKSKEPFDKSNFHFMSKYLQTNVDPFYLLNP